MRTERSLRQPQQPARPECEAEAAIVERPGGVPHGASAARRRGPTRRAAWLLPVLAAACAGERPEPPASAASPTFDPLGFFAGRTEGRGRLHVALGHAGAVSVHGSGVVGADGSLHLVQTVEREGRQPTRREWVFRRVGTDRYAGTLSDARGPVVAEADGNRLHIRFRMVHGMIADQWLVLQPGGQSADNLMTVRTMGMLVARLDERIVRVSDRGG